MSKTKNKNHHFFSDAQVDRICTMIEDVAPITFGIFFIAMLAIVCTFR